MKARTVMNNRALSLIIPADGHAPMLFMEWVAERKVLCTIKVSRDVDGELPVLKIRLKGEARGTYAEFVDYINSNL